MWGVEPEGTVLHAPAVGRMERGAFYTRPWVVDFILDLAGYGPDEDLVDAVAVEPSCGDGEFLEPMIRRLSASCRRQARPLQDCAGSIRAFDTDLEAVRKSRRRAESVLLECGWEAAEAGEVVNRWVRQADFLLRDDAELSGADFVIGNPPYVRLESIKPEVAAIYRSLFRTMAGRADLYVGFYEKALGLLKPDGVCGFICADRWMLNQYGGNLRRHITGGFRVEAVIEMHDADAFRDDVLAYPAITIVRRAKQGRALVARMNRLSDKPIRELVETVRELRTERVADAATAARSEGYVIVDEWFEGSEPWPCASPERLKLLKNLEARFLPLEDSKTRTRVGIGVATGADRVFMTRDPDLVEEDRLLPVALAGDTITGALEWSGHYLLNPWEPDGSLVNLERYPRLRRYFEDNEAVLRGRNVGRRNPLSWYRTIDKVNHALTARPKLLIPDIKSAAHPVFDSGTVYPHHNLYYVTSEGWDLKVLGGILLSRIGQFFIECYAVRMHGGYLRFQAQYLRRIRVPRPEDVEPEQAKVLASTFEERDVDGATRAALELYGIEEIPG